MASNALVQLMNNSTEDYTFSVDISKPVKFVNRLVLPASQSAEVEVEVVIPLVLFDRNFQNAIAAGTITMSYTFTTAAGTASTAEHYLHNIQRFLGANTSGWVAC